MWKYLFDFYVIFILSLFVLIFLGKGFRFLFPLDFSGKTRPQKILDRNIYIQLLEDLVVGMVVVICTIAFISTGFKTVFVLIFPFLFIYHNLIQPFRFKEVRPSFKSLVSPYSPKTILSLFLGATGLFFVQALMWTEEGFSKIIAIDGDIYFYAQVSNFISQTGQENNFNQFNLLSEAFQGTNPYHYFDLWLNSAIAKLSNLLHYETLLLITYPIFYFGAFIGLCSLFSTQIRNRWKFVFSFLMVFAGGIIFGFYQYIPFFGAVDKSIGYDIISYPKTGIVMLVLFMVIHQIKSKEFLNSIGLFLLLPIFYFTTLPAVVGGLSLFLIAGMLFKPVRILDQKIAIRLLLVAYLTFVMIIVFFAITKSDISSGLVFASLELNSILRQAIPLIKAPLFNIINYLPYLILFAITALVSREYVQKGLKENKFLIGITSATLIAGLGVWVLLYYTPDSYQLFENLGKVFIYLMVMIGVVKIIELSWNNKAFSGTLFKGAIILTLSLNFFSTITHSKISSKGLLGITSTVNQQSTYRAYAELESPSTNYLRSINDILIEKPTINTVGIALRSKESFYSIFSKNLLIERTGYYLNTIKDGFGTFTINDFEMPIGPGEGEPVAFKNEEVQRRIETSMLNNSFFFNYVKQQKEENRFQSIEDSQLQVIYEHEIDYIIKQKGATIPNSFSAMVKLIAEDEVTGDSFYLINRETVQ